MLAPIPGERPLLAVGVHLRWVQSFEVCAVATSPGSPYPYNGVCLFFLLVGFREANSNQPIPGSGLLKRTQLIGGLGWPINRYTTHSLAGGRQTTRQSKRNTRAIFGLQNLDAPSLEGNHGLEATVFQRFAQNRTAQPRNDATSKARQSEHVDVSG